MKFVKYKKNWWKIAEDAQIDNASIYSYDCMTKHHMDLREFEIIEASSFFELDWTDTVVLNSKSKYGWLDRNGNFYGCDFACHSDQADLVHKTSSDNLEKLGWIHISAISPDKPGTIFAEFFGDYKNGVLPTDKQLEYIMAHPEMRIDSIKKALEGGNYIKAQLYERSLLAKHKNNNKDDDKEL